MTTKFKEFGLYYGYPVCCIESFLKDVCSQISYAKYYDSVNPLIAGKADPSKTSAIIKRQLTSK